MRSMIAVFAALLCASCGGGSSSTSSMMSSSAMQTSVAPPSSPPTSSSPPSSSSPPTSSSPPSSSSNPPSSTTTPPPPSNVPVYTIVEIPALATTGSATANAVNDSGIVVGQQETTGSPRAWMYQQSTGALDELTFTSTESGAGANGISNSGVIAGYEINGGPPQAGFWTTTGGAMLLTGQYQYSTQAVAANDSGTIVGNSAAPGVISSLPMVWSGSAHTETTLGGLRCDYCNRISVAAAAIDEAGEIAGSSNYSIYDNSGSYVTSGIHAVAWQGGNIADLGGLQAATYSEANGVNSEGDIVGGSRVGPTDGAPTHAFLFHDGAMSDLGTLPGDTNSSASSVNDSGQIVGSSQGATTTRAFLYQNGHMYDLSSLIDPASQLAGIVSLEDAVGISQTGWIAVNGTDSRDPGRTRALLLIPSRRVPPP